jgi:hypothetical protein
MLISPMNLFTMVPAGWDGNGLHMETLIYSLMTGGFWNPGSILFPWINPRKLWPVAIFIMEKRTSGFVQDCGTGLTGM